MMQKSVEIPESICYNIELRMKTNRLTGGE